MRRSLGSVTKKPSGAWLVRVTLPSLDGTQRRVSKTVRGSKREAEKVLADMLAQSGQLAAEDLTLAQFAGQYREWHDREYPRRDAMAHFHRELDRAVADFPGYKLSQLTPQLMETWGASAPEYKVNVLKAAFNKAVDWRLMERNPLAAVKPHRARPKKQRFSAADAALIVEAFRGAVIEPVVLLMLMCGMRREEALAMDWARIDFRTGLARIDRSWHYESGEGWFEATKNASSVRMVTIDPATLARLDEIRRAGGVVRVGAVAEIRPGVRIPPSTCADHWAAVAKPLLGKRYLPMKSLRHTHASLCLEAGVPMEAIAKRLGHASTRLTESTYAEAPQIEAGCAEAMTRTFTA